MIEYDTIVEGEVTQQTIEGQTNIYPNEIDPTVPKHVKEITKEDIEKWNKGGTGGGGNSGVYVGEDEPPSNANVWINPNGKADRFITNVRLENQNLIFTYNDDTTFSVTLNASETTGLTEEQIQAINEMVATNGEELTLEYDDEVLDIDFIIEDNNLVVTNNVVELDFNINENGEMEAIY